MQLIVAFADARRHSGLPVCRPLFSGISFGHDARPATAGPCTGAAAAAP